MSESRDQFALIKIDGMHCHNCERAIQKLLSSIPGVSEAEVDFNSKQASVIFTRDQVNVKDLMDAINDAGYQASGFTQGPK